MDEKNIIDKIMDFLREYPAIKIFGGLGIIIMIVIFIFTTILQVEIEDKWKGIVHSKSNTNNTNRNNVKEKSNKEDDSEKDDFSVDQIEITSEPDEDQKDTYTDSEIKGTLDVAEERNELFMANITGRYRFDFEIDNVNKSYIFIILNSKSEEIASEYSSDKGLTIDLEANEKYTLCIRNNGEEKVEYGISINQPDETESIEEGFIDDSIRYIDQQKSYTYCAQKTGIYRFDFDIDDVNKEYRVYIEDAKSNSLMEKSSSNEGGNVQFTAGEVYTIWVVQSEDLPSYTIKISAPNDAEIVTKNVISGTVDYIGQNNVYYYVPVRTGIHRFDFDIDNVNNEYDFCIYNKKREQLVYRNSSDEGVTVELQKGEKYELQIIQNTGFVRYNIQINVPKKSKVIDKASIKDKINFIDQQNIYYFTTRKSGKYIFKFSSNNVDNRYEIYILDSKNQIIYHEDCSEDERELELKKNEKYKIYIEYSRGFGKYEISIK